MLVAGLITLVGGLLASSGFIVKRVPNADKLIEKLAPYQGWIGVCMFGWGVSETFATIARLGWISSAPLSFAFLAFNAVVDLTVGLLLGFNLINHYVLSRNATAAERGAQIRAKLINYQVPAGLAGLVLGVLLIVYPF